MLARVIMAEYLKLKKSKILLAFFILPIISAVFGTANYLQNLQILKNGWYSLWTQHTLFLSYFFLPVLIGLIVAFSFKLEQNSWNTFASAPVKRKYLILGKFVVCVFFATLALVLVAVLYLLSGFYSKLEGMPVQILMWILRGMLGVLAVVAVQILISLVIKNFAIPVGLAFMFGIMGLMLISIGTWQISPYTLVAVGLNSNGSGDLQSDNLIMYIVLSVIFTISALTIASIILTKRDIKNS